MKSYATHICEILSVQNLQITSGIEEYDYLRWSKELEIGYTWYVFHAALNQGTLEVSFTREGRFGADPRRSLDDIQQQTREIIAALPQFFNFVYTLYQKKKQFIHNIKFSAALWDHSRVKLYNHLASRFAQQLHGRTIEKNHPDTGEVIFTIHLTE